MTPIEWALVLVELIVPVLLFLARKGAIERDKKLDKIGVDVDHLHDCIEGLKLSFAGGGATKGDISGLKADILQEIGRMKDENNRNSNGLHERIMRLEGPFFSSRS